jgi:hypothetical protein
MILKASFAGSDVIYKHFNEYQNICSFNWIMDSSGLIHWLFFTLFNREDFKSHTNYFRIFLCLLIFSGGVNGQDSAMDRDWREVGSPAAQEKIRQDSVGLGVNDTSALKEDKESDFFVDNLIKQWFQRQQDSTYIASYTNELSLRLTGITKLNYFQIRDGEADALVRYRPESKISAGIGVTYKWFSLDVTFRIGLPNEEVESTNAFDFSGRVFGLKQYAGITYKYYFGYEIDKMDRMTGPLPDSISQRNDIRTSYINLEYMYAFNYGKFSFKAPFFYNEIQKKSAGSFVAGASFVNYLLDGDQSVLPEDARQDFNPKLAFHSLYLASLSLQFGYMYTIVIGGNFYITLGLIPVSPSRQGIIRFQKENR